MGKRKNWKGPGGDVFLKDAYDLYKDQGNLDGLGPRTDPDSGNTYRVRKGDKKTFNLEKRTGLRIQSVNPVEGVSKGIAASATERVARINKATLTQNQFIKEARTFFKENNIKKLNGQNATQVGKEGYKNYKGALNTKLSGIDKAGQTKAHVRPTTDKGFIESAQNYYGEGLSKNAADKARVPTKKQQKLTKTDLTKSQFMRSQMGLGQDLSNLSDTQVKTILDKSKIKVPSREAMRKGGWTRVMGRSRRVLNTGGDNPRTNLTGNVQSLQPFQQLMEHTYPQDFIHESGIVPPIPLV